MNEDYELWFANDKKVQTTILVTRYLTIVL